MAAPPNAEAETIAGKSCDGDGSAVTIILLSNGDLDMLDSSLDALSRQDLQAPYEILVVDDAFEGATARLVGNWASRLSNHLANHLANHPCNHDPIHHIVLRYQASTGPAGNAASALNLGWRAASSPVVAFTGIDTVAARNWLHAGLAAFDDGAPLSATMPASPTSAAPSSATAATASPSEQPDQAGQQTQPGRDSAATHGGRIVAVFGGVDCRLPKHPTEVQLQIHARDHGDFPGCNWFIRRSTLEQLGGFDERFRDAGDETCDLVCRLQASGVPLAHAPSAMVCRPMGPASWGASLLDTRRLCSDALLQRKYPQLYRQHLHRPAPPVWHDLAITAALLLASLGLWTHQEILAVAAGGCWLVLTAMFCIHRLRDSAHTPAHLAEVLLTSPFVPVLALFWRLVGTLRYRTRFAQS
jgi:hypothetical protein